MSITEFQHDKVRLGKHPYRHDERTLMLARFILPDIRVPESWDFDADRRPFPDHMWGNDDWGDCVIAAESNQLLRLQRIETHQTMKLTDEDAIARYMRLSGAQAAGDPHDIGLEPITAFRDWRNTGYFTDYKGRTFKIAAYGELEPADHQQTRMASYLLHGTQWGFSLPAAAQQMTRNGVWDYNGETGPEWRPGSWGGHMVFSKKFDPESMEVLTWERKVKVTNNFIDHYADEAWAVVDSFDPWRKTRNVLDVAGLEKQLSQISQKVDQ